MLFSWFNIHSELFAAEICDDLCQREYKQPVGVRPYDKKTEASVPLVRIHIILNHIKYFKENPDLVGAPKDDLDLRRHIDLLTFYRLLDIAEEEVADAVMSYDAEAEE